MVYQFAMTFISVVAMVGPAVAQTDAQPDPYAVFLEEVAEGDGGACRRLMVERRVENWHGPSVAEAFASVEAIMADVTGGPEFRELGCSREFRDFFLACSTIDDPTQTHIVPRGVNAATVPEQVALMQSCLGLLEEAGLKPGGLG